MRAGAEAKGLLGRQEIIAGLGSAGLADECIDVGDARGTAVVRQAQHRAQDGEAQQRACADGADLDPLHNQSPR